MKFTGRELINIGVPSNKIKYFINKEFDSENDVLIKLSQINKPKEKVNDKFTITDWIWNCFPHLPMMLLGNKPIKMSKSELRRILDSKGIRINNQYLDSKMDINNIDFPIIDFVWFPKSERKTTWI